MFALLSTVDPRVIQAHAERIKTALRYANLSLDKAAVWMEMDQSLLRRQLTGDGHISYTRLVKLPLVFWQWFHFLGAQESGLPKVIKRAARLQVALLGRKKMARVELDVDDERKLA